MSSELSFGEIVLIAKGKADGGWVNKGRSRKTSVTG